LTLVQIGESFVGNGANAAHVNTVLGRRDGPVGAAWVASLATPSAGHARFVAVAQPGVAISPPTLFVNKAPIGDDAHGTMTWGPAQAGLAKGVAEAFEDGVLAAGEVDDLVLIAAVWVNPAADDAGAVYENNRAATREALRNGRDGRPRPEEYLAAAASPWNPFFTPG
jgi:5,6,7,8-tetrahydromethanopterin hydro-lyase